MTKTISHSLTESTILDELKQSEVIPVYKKLFLLQKMNYRPVSLLPHMSTKQINKFMESKISEYITSFSKTHGTQHSLIVILESWRKA